MRFGPLFAVALLVPLLARAQEPAQAPPAEPPPAPRPAPLRIVFTSAVGGHFATPRCTDDVAFEPSTFAPHSRALHDAASDPSTFAFDAGGLFEPHGVGRFAVEHDREAVADLVRGIGYDALAFGSKDLQSSRTPFVLLALTLRRYEIPFVASNLRCTGASARLCAAVDDADEPVRIVERGAERVALIALLDPLVLPHVSADNRRDITLEPIANAIHRRVAEARAAGATFVVVSIDNGSGQRAAGATIALAESLPEADRPDLLVSARAGRELLFARPASYSPPIASTAPGAGASVEVRRRAGEAELDLAVRPLPTSNDPDESLAAFNAAIGPDYCAELGRPLPGGHLATELDRSATADLLGGAIRQAADAEIAVVNVAMIADDFARPSGHSLSPSDVQLALQFDEPIVVASVDAAYLAAVARTIATRPGMRAVGLAVANPGAGNEAITINGRPLDSRGRYRIAVPLFLSTGGDEVFPSGPTWAPTPGAATTRGALLAWLSVARTVDPRVALGNPADRLEWAFSLTSDTSVGNAAVDNPGAYADTQFERADSMAYGTENDLGLVARSRRMSWENELIARYRTTRNLGGPYAESDDLLSFRSTFAYTEARVRHPNWWMPEPFAETYVETEFTVPDDRAARHFLVRPTAGGRLALTGELSLKLQAGGAFELFDRAVDPSPGIGAVLTLTRWKFFEAGRRNGTLEALFDWFFSGLGTSPRHTMRGNLELAIQFNHVLGVSFTGTLFAVNTPDSRFSYVVNSTANLRLRWFVRTQR